LNILFFIIVSCLVLSAFAFILPTLWRKHPVTGSDLPVDQDQRNIIIARQRLTELKEQKLSGVLSQLQYDEQFAELEQALSDDLDIKSHVIVSKSQGRWMVYVLALAIPLLAGSLYFTLGNVQAISHSAEMAKANPQVPSAADINKMVAGLAERLKSNPDDSKGWLMLGRSYTQLEQFPKAVDAYANAYRILGDQVEVMLQYAEAIAFANDKNLNGRPSELINKALSIEPENMNALWLGGMMKAQQNDRQGAITLWRKLEALLPPGAEEAKKEIQVVIANMENPAAGASQITATESTKTAGVSIDIEVNLAPELQKSVNPGDTVFIYAQALSGPKMPLAIVRKQVSDLPITVNLNDSMAMMPEMKLSKFESVKLLARISKSGNAMTQAGDLIGVIEQVALSDAGNPHKIVINSEVKK
jgi:cytochrome c-type biogenesis protein CcmH